MDGIKFLLFLIASAQVQVGTERDYGWAVNKEDGVLEYIVQINDDKKRAMEQKSIQFPNGRENVSNMPQELVGRASRVVIRFGTEILPREPSLQELERSPRLFEPPNVSAAAVLGEDKFRNLEAPVRNIQGQGTTPVLPALPSGLPGSGSTPSLLQDDLNERLADALPSSGLPNSGLSSSNQPNSSMPGRGIPDPSTLAQNFPNQLGGTSSLVDDARAAANSKFNSTASPANVPLSTATNPQQTTPTRLPEYPPTTNAPFATNNQASSNNMSSRTPGGLGANNSTAPLYPDRLNPPSLGNSATIPQQRTPSTTFGTSPGLTNNAANNWNPQATPNAQSYSPGISQPYDNYGSPTNYAGNSNPNGYPNTTLVASNPPPYVPPLTNSSQTTNQINTGGLSREQIDAALAVRGKLDKNNDGQLTPEEYSLTSVDPILLTLFVVSLLVNLYLGHLIRKLLMRYRVVLTNVRSQTAYT